MTFTRKWSFPFPYSKRSPRAQADVVRFHNRQYSLDGRRRERNKPVLFDDGLDGNFVDSIRNQSLSFFLVASGLFSSSIKELFKFSLKRLK